MTLLLVFTCNSTLFNWTIVHLGKWWLLCNFNFLLLIGTSNSITYHIQTVGQLVFRALVIWHWNVSLLLAIISVTCFNWELLCPSSSNWSFPLCIVPNKTPGETVLRLLGTQPCFGTRLLSSPSRRISQLDVPSSHALTWWEPSTWFPWNHLPFTKQP